MAAFPDRALNAIVLSAAHVAAYPPDTAAAGATGATAQAPASPAAAPAAAATLAAHLAARQHPAAMARPQRGAPSVWWRAGVEPFWADMIAAGAGDIAASSFSAASAQRGNRPRCDRPVDVVPDSAEDAALAISEQAAARPGRPGGHRWDLVVVEWGCRWCGDGLGLLGADLLAPGGVLAVLTHSERRAGRLLDPTGSVVASAQAADLLYLQHIVLLTAPLHTTPPDTRPDTEADAGTPTSTARILAHHPEPPDPGAESALGGGVMDLLLFLQPGDPSQSSAPDEPPIVAPQPATAEEASAASAAAGRAVDGGRA